MGHPEVPVLIASGDFNSGLQDSLADSRGTWRVSAVATSPFILKLSVAAAGVSDLTHLSMALAEVLVIGGSLNRSINRGEN